MKKVWIEGGSFQGSMEAAGKSRVSVWHSEETYDLMCFLIGHGHFIELVEAPDYVAPGCPATEFPWCCTSPTDPDQLERILRQKHPDYEVMRVR